MRFVPQAIARNGRSVVGAIDAVASDVVGFAPGDRVASLGARRDSSATRLLDPENLIGIPRDVTAEQAAALLFDGLIARVLVKEARAVGGGEIVLVQGAHGLLGRLIVAWASELGARVIAMVAPGESGEEALRAGAEATVSLGEPDAQERIRDLTGGRGVDVVYDGNGHTGWNSSLAFLREGGDLVLYGHAAERVLPDVAGISVLRPRLSEHLRAGSIQQGASDVFVAIRTGIFEGIDVMPLVAEPVVSAA